MKIYFYGLFLLFGIHLTSAQTTISGKVSAEKEGNLSGATVTISKDSTASISSYTITDVDGNFLIHFDMELDSVFLKISYVGYDTWAQNLPNKTQQLQVELSPSIEELKEVSLESNRIERKGDTINYTASAFKEKKDRVLADVLAKMPGIEIRGSGAIYYQGKPIQKFYIEGLDLLEGRYSLANENLPVNSVSKVQILENHQPVKILDSLVFSERASLNIELKNDVTLTGSGEVGSGLPPFLWNANATPMLFTKDNQAIFSFQANNTGNEVSSALDDITSFEEANDFSIAKKDLLSLIEVSTPPFAEEKWLDNNIILGAANYLIKLKKDFQLKTSISYVNDVQGRSGSTKTIYFTPADTTEVLEQIGNELFFSSLKSQATLERNTRDNYLKNDLKINAFWDSQRGMINRNDGTVSQELENPYFAFSNDLRLLEPVGKQLLTIKSKTGYTNTPQKLMLKPGQFEELLNDGLPYAKLVQQVKLRNFFTDNSAGFTKALGNFTFSPEIGFSLQNQILESGIELHNNGDSVEWKDGFQNNLHFLRSSLYAKTTMNYKADTWSLRLDLLLIYKTFRIKDEVLLESQGLNRLISKPQFYLKKEISPYLDSSISAGLDNTFGDIDRLHSGYILNNYRSIQRYDAPMAESFRQNYSWRFSYRNPLSAIFGHLSYALGVTENNLLYSNIFDENGATIFEALAQENTSFSHSFNLGASKYFSNLNTTLSTTSSYSISKGQKLLNQQTTEVTNRNIRFDFEITTEITDWLSTEYKNEFSYFNTQLNEDQFDDVVTQQHLWDVTVYPADNHYFEISSELYTNPISEENKRNYFLNLLYQFTFAEQGINLNIGWKNVFNTNEFLNIYNPDFSYIQSTYSMRPSQVLVKMKFSF